MLNSSELAIEGKSGFGEETPPLTRVIRALAPAFSSSTSKVIAVATRDWVPRYVLPITPNQSQLSSGLFALRTDCVLGCFA